VTAYRDVSLAALASADLEQARHFVGRELGPLAADDDYTVKLAATLRVYLEERSSPRRTAQRLGVHENTIVKRIHTARELLNRPVDTRISELLVGLRLAPLVREPGSKRPESH
jgi:DNA-binding PucR family transcriptional regulator